MRVGSISDIRKKRVLPPPAVTTSGRGPELFNSDMSASGWSDLSVPAGSASFSGGKLTLTGAGSANRGRVTRTVPPAVIAGRTYELLYTIDSVNASTQVAVVGIKDTFPITTPGEYGFIAKATASNPEATVNVYGTGTAVFSKLSLREVF